MSRPFKRMNAAAKLGGICGGAAYWLELPAWVVRAVLLVALFSAGVGFWLYIALWLLMPQWDVDPSDYREVTSD